MIPRARTPLAPEDLAELGRRRSGGVDLTDAQARVLGSLHAHAFSGPRSCPSQDLIAREVGLTREWTNRTCRDLWALGLIAWTKARGRGAKWAHNIYRLRHWQPAGTARVLALIERIRGRFPRPVHTETATTAPRTPLGSCVARYVAETAYEPVFEEVAWPTRGSPELVAPSTEVDTMGAQGGVRWVPDRVPWEQWPPPPRGRPGPVMST